MSTTILRKALIASAAVGISSSAIAQQPAVPALQGAPAGAVTAMSPQMNNQAPALQAAQYNGPPPPLPALLGRQKPLAEREQAAIRQSNEWANRSVTPMAGAAGLTYFTFGQTRPTLVCAPLALCRIELQEGEEVNNVNIGDPLGWEVSPGKSGEGPTAKIQVLLKPKEIGLQTNIMIATNRRLYDIELVSRKSDRMAGLAFHYPADQQATWANFNDSVRRERAAQEATKVAAQQAAAQQAAAQARKPPVLRFEFEISGDSPRWKPLRAYHDGQRTYIEFPQGLRNAEAPAFVLLSDDNEQQIANYRQVNNYYVIDQVVERCALLAGVGRKQTRVEIRRTGKS